MIKRVFFFLFLSVYSFAQSVGEDNNKFAFAFYSQFQGTNDNLAFSPYGIFSNLSLLYFGSDGDTAKQIKSALHLSAKGNSFLNAFHKHLFGLTRHHEFGYQLQIANGLFPHQGTHILKKFQDIATETYGAKLQSVDFSIPSSALRIINSWISEKTQGKISQMLQPADINSATRLVVLNTVFFDGDWVHPFNARMTTTAPFYPEAGSSIDVQMLHQTHSFSYFENDQIQLLSLPFMRNQVAQPFLECLIVLPKQGDLNQLETALEPQILDQWLSDAKLARVEVQIPKFCFSKRLSLNDSLQKLGIRDAFTYQADLSKIDGMRDLYLQSVLHETYFSFHENGVTAASATSSQIGVTATPPPREPPIEFIADHPFLFFIVDHHSRAILFMGRVTNPKVDACK